MLFYLSVLPLVYVRAKGNLEPGTLRAQSTWVEDEEGQEIHTVVVCIFDIGPEDSPACSSSVKYVLLLPLPFLCLPLLLESMWPLVADLCLKLHSLAQYVSHAVAHLHVCLELCVGIKGAASKSSRQFGQFTCQSHRAKNIVFFKRFSNLPSGNAHQVGHSIVGHACG